jgi:hypothetical protein
MEVKVADEEKWSLLFHTLSSQVLNAFDLTEQEERQCK